MVGAIDNRQLMLRGVKKLLHPLPDTRAFVTRPVHWSPMRSPKLLRHSPVKKLSHPLTDTPASVTRPAHWSPVRSPKLLRHSPVKKSSHPLPNTPVYVVGESVVGANVVGANVVGAIDDRQPAHPRRAASVHV